MALDGCSPDGATFKTMTVLEIIQDAVADGLGLPRTPMQLDILKEGIAKYRKCGKTIFDMFPWDYRKISIFDTANTTYVTSYDTATGIIVFGPTIDIVRAVRSVDSTDASAVDTLVWPQSEIDAAINGVDVSSVRFVPLDDSADGYRRIQVNADDEIATYKILALKRFIPAVIDASYDAGDPTATPTDYRSLSWPIDHADASLIAYMSDELRTWDGQKAKNDWGNLLQVAIGKVDRQQARGKEVYPASPSFGDLEGWGDM